MLLLLLLIALILSTLPWLPSRAAVGEEGNWTAEASGGFTREAQGPDGAYLVETPQDAMAVRIALLRAATQSMDIVYHAIQPDDTGMAFLAEVLDAADRGVSIRILLDGKVGTPGKAKAYLRALQAHPNITCRLYNPIQLLHPAAWQAILHDKFMLVDGQYLLLGGRNIGDRFYAPSGYTKAVTNDRDVLVVGNRNSAGSVMAQLEAYMEDLWNAEETQAMKAQDGAEATWALLRKAAQRYEAENPDFYAKSMADYAAQVLPTNKVSLLANPVHKGKKVPVIARGLKGLALGAKDSVIFQTPYATASDDLMDALLEIDENAETVLLTNSMASSPNFIAFSNYASQRQRFLEAGLDIYELQSRDSIHGKSMVVDGRVSAVGSLNMDDRSFYIATESMLVIDSVPFAGALEEAMGVYIDASLQVGLDNRYVLREGVPEMPVAWQKRVGMNITSLFSRALYFLV